MTKKGAGEMNITDRLAAACRRVIDVVDCLDPNCDTEIQYRLGKPVMDALRSALAAHRVLTDAQHAAAPATVPEEVRAACELVLSAKSADSEYETAADTLARYVRDGGSPDPVPEDVRAACDRLDIYAGRLQSIGQFPHGYDDDADTALLTSYVRNGGSPAGAAGDGRYAAELDAAAEILTQVHPIGRVKAIGRLEVVAALKELLTLVADAPLKVEILAQQRDHARAELATLQTIATDAHYAENLIRDLRDRLATRDAEIDELKAAGKVMCDECEKPTAHPICTECVADYVKAKADAAVEERDRVWREEAEWCLEEYPGLKTCVMNRVARRIATATKP